MKTLNKKLISALLLLFLASFSGCKQEPPKDAVDATIIYDNFLDSCNDYIVIVDNDTPFGIIYKPENLPAKFAVDKLKVKITFDIVNDKKHNCGFGGYVSVIHLNSINKAK